MTAKHGLTDKTLKQIAELFALFPEVEKAVLFGSRAKETHKPGSDIDLALVGAGVDWQTIGRVNSALDDLPIPYCFSVILLSDKTDPEVAANIQRVGIPVFERTVAAAQR